jgi:DHA1 family quinolone resistance protein-like MFS transporter
MNNTIKLLMFSDIFVMTGFGLIEPILAIFIKENLVGGTIFAAGLASTLFLITKCIVQLPFSRYVDNHDEKVRWLIVGTLIIAAVPFMYIFAKDINHIYFAQILYGIGSGLAYPTWLGLWSTNLDRQHESFEWSLYSTLTGLGTALTAAVGAAIAEFAGFTPTFVLVGALSLAGCLTLLGLERKKEKEGKTTTQDYHTKRKLAGKRH